MIFWSAAYALTNCVLPVDAVLFPEASKYSVDNNLVTLAQCRWGGNVENGN